MKLALIQQTAGPDRQANLEKGLAAAQRAADAGAKLICFAELSFEPFYPQRPAEGDPRGLAQTVPGAVTDAFCALAAERSVVCVLNLYELAGDHCYDSSPVIDADGSLLGVTRMVHITDYACFHEQGYYAHGDRGRRCSRPRRDLSASRSATTVTIPSTCGLWR